MKTIIYLGIYITICVLIIRQVSFYMGENHKDIANTPFIRFLFLSMMAILVMMWIGFEIYNVLNIKNESN